jgi:hypothetical protein
MGKRFTDTALNRQPWFRKLKPKMKCAVRFLFDECDNAGVWIIDMETMSYFVGEEVTQNELFEKVNSDKENRIELFGSDKIFIPGFISFQYGELSESCKPHRPIINLLKKYNLYERVLKGYCNTIETLEEKDIEKEKEKETEKDEGGMGETTGITHQLLNQYTTVFPTYHKDPSKDLRACLAIAYKIAKDLGIPKHEVHTNDQVKIRWGEIIVAIAADKWYRKKALSYINEDWQSVNQLFHDQKQNNGTHLKSVNQSGNKPGRSAINDSARANY